MNRKGFTLIEVFIVIGIVSIILAVLFPLIFGFNKDNAEQSMISYINTLYPEYQDVKCICSNKDSDNNGYVRCTATAINNKDEKVMIVAECDGSGNCAPIQNIDR